MSGVLFVTELTSAPFGQIALASKLRADGIDADIYINALQDKRRLFERIGEEKPDVIGFTLYDYTVPGVDKFFEKVREISPDSYIAIGGPFPTLCLEGSC